MEEIQRQKEVVKGLMPILRLIDPCARVAGGAPRDWYMGVPANDVDIYVRNFGNSDSYVENLSSVLGVSVVRKGCDAISAYNPMEGFLFTLTFQLEGVSFDLVFMRENTDVLNVHYDMDFSLSRIAWNDTTDTYDQTKEFRHSIAYRTMQFSLRKKENEFYVEKMRQRFGKEYKELEERFTAGYIPF